MHRNTHTTTALLGHSGYAATFLLALGAACQPIQEPRGSFTEATDNRQRFAIEGVGDAEPFTRVTVPVEVVPGTAGLTNQITEPSISFGEATVVGDESTGFAWMYVELRNTGDTPLCFVNGEPLEFLNETGRVLASEVSFADGSVAMSEGGSVTTGSCLIEGGEALLLEIISELDVTAVASVRVAMAATDAWEFNAAEADVVPVAVVVEGGDLDQNLVVTLENSGTVPATLETAKVVFFDESGEFLDWGFTDEPVPQTIGPGESAVANVDLFSVSGIPTEVSVHVSWDE